MPFLKRIKRKLFGNPEQQEMKYLLEHGLHVGKNFQCFSPYAFDSNWPWLISVGDDVLVSTGVKILSHDASTNFVDAHTKIGIVDIGNHVFTGANTTILPNVRIGDDVIVGAGSVVSKDIPAGSVCAGNPARVICSIEEHREKHQKSLNQHKLFSEHKWDEWPSASSEEWRSMREALQDTWGYV